MEFYLVLFIYEYNRMMILSPKIRICLINHFECIARKCEEPSANEEESTGFQSLKSQ